MKKSFSCCAAIALLCSIQGWPWKHHVVYRFILPKDYVGWVRVDFGVEGAPELDVEDIKTGTKATVIVPKSGIIETDTTFVNSTWESYELYFRDEDRLVRVPKALYSSKFMLDGFSATLRDDSGKPKALSWYFMIGPKTLRAKYPTEAYLKPSAEMPRPGLISEAAHDK